MAGKYCFHGTRGLGCCNFGAMVRLLLLTPPFTQLNTPYPATAYLKGYLNTQGVATAQADLGIEVIDRIFCSAGLQGMLKIAEQQTLCEHSQHIVDQSDTYLRTIDSVMRFLRGRDTTLARQIAQPGFLPVLIDERDEADMEWAFGTMGLYDRAKLLGTRYLEQLSQFIVETIDPDFGFTRYAEQLGRCAYSFDDLQRRLESPWSYVDQQMEPILASLIEAHAPEWVGLSVPFPGNLLGALRIGQWLRTHHPTIKIVMGGGFPNTELRSLKDPRLFDYLDAVTLDDGETPMMQLLARSTDAQAPLRRTFLRINQEVVYQDSTLPDVKLSELGTPDYSGLTLDLYLNAIEQTNPMHSLWSDGRWNKLTLAHGCYWARCTFCDISLDYISVYEPVAARILVDRMEELVASTGQTGFHFVDEAAPPSLLRSLALEILRRNFVVTWWTNIRFEKRFTADLCRLLRRAGCVAVAGGLEVASDRLLELIDKGVTVDQVAQVAAHFTDSGILVHAYLMYGFPTQTASETMDSMERVRQLFEAGVIHSGFWHRFALTAHSPVGQNPEKFGIIAEIPEVTFALNDLPFTDPTGTDHATYGEGLRISLYNWMRGEGLDLPLRRWFDAPTPKPKLDKNWALSVLETPAPNPSPHAQLIYVGSPPVFRDGRIICCGMGSAFEQQLSKEDAEIWIQRLNELQKGIRKVTWLEGEEWNPSSLLNGLMESHLILAI